MVMAWEAAGPDDLFCHEPVDITAAAAALGLLPVPV